MSADIIEAVMAVEEVNMAFCEKAGDSCPRMTLTTDGSWAAISCLGVELWRNYEDSREFDEEKDEYEPLVGFLIKEFTKQVQQVQEVSNLVSTTKLSFDESQQFIKLSKTHPILMGHLFPQRETND